MIFTLTRGAARVLFNLAVVFMAIGLLFVYGAYRLVRSSVAGRKPQPVREAGFGTLLAVVALVQAVKAAAPSPVAERVYVDVPIGDLRYPEEDHGDSSAA